MEIVGDEFDNTLEGTGQDDLIVGAGGDDVLSGNNGDDELRGGVGEDTLFGGGGADLLLGGAGNDLLYGDGGDDNLQGQGGADTLYGGNLEDTLEGGNGNDLIYGQEGADTLIGGSGDDRLFAGVPQTVSFVSPVTQVDAGTGNDTFATALDLTGLFGLSDNTDIPNYDTWQSTTVEAIGSGAKHYYKIEILEGETYSFDIDYGFDPGGSVDTILTLYDENMEFLVSNDDAIQDPGSEYREDSLLRQVEEETGTYFLEVSAFILGGIPDGATYTLHASTTSENRQAEMLYGEGGDDILTGSTNLDQLYGGIGDDQLFASGGDDHAFGGAGADLIQGGGGDDMLYGLDGNDIMNGGAGDDTLFGGNGGDTLHGGTGDDTLYGTRGDNRLFGGQGDDELFAGERNGFLDGGTGNNILHGSTQYTTVFNFNGAIESSNLVTRFFAFDTIMLNGFGYESASDVEDHLFEYFDSVIFANERTIIEFANSDIAEVLAAVEVDQPAASVVESSDAPLLAEPAAFDDWIADIA